MLVIAWLLGRFSTLAISDVERPSRHGALDGLRGLCATAVFIHHSAMAFTLYSSGKWRPLAGLGGLEGNFMGNLGSMGVMLFFMITGFLFIDRMIVKKGIEDWGQFYRKRLLRIAPLYLFVVSVVALVCLAYGLPSGPLEFLKQYIPWLGFGFFRLPDIGGYSSSWTVVCGVLWTLAIEWKFYFVLPVIGVLCISRGGAGSAVAASVVATVALSYSGSIEGKSAVIVLCFAVGGLAAYVFETKWRDILNKWPCGIVASVGLFAAVSYSFTSYNYLSLTAVGFFFLCVASGNSFFGSLSFKPLKVLGLISYSIYLCHGLALLAASKMTDDGLYVYGLTAAALLVPGCLLTYLYIERPFISGMRSAQPPMSAQLKSQ